MPHWKSIHIERFRRLENLRLDDLGTVNLLVGKNNSGKTSVLEALAIASDPTNAFNWIDVGRERELKSARTPVLEVLNWFFSHKAPRINGFEGTAAIEGQIRSGETLRMTAAYREYRELEITPAPDDLTDSESEGEEASEYAALLAVEVQRLAPDGRVLHTHSTAHEFKGRSYKRPENADPIFPFQLVSPVSHRTSRQLLEAVDRIVQDRSKGEIISLMKLLADDVDDIEIRSPQGRGAVVHLHHTGIGHVPLAMEGDGMRRALAFASAAALARNGVLLIDEIETALHPDALAGIFRFLVQVCRASGVQLFISTHSLEAVDAILASVGDDVGDLVAYHLPPQGSFLSAYRLGGKSIRSMRTESGLDLR